MIKIIGEDGFTSFTKLKKDLMVSTGTIYHHLETLSQLIEQKEDKKYYLTDLGKAAYASIKNNVETLISPDISKREFNSPLLKGLMYLTPKSLIINTKEKNFLSLALSVVILTTGAVFCYLNGLFPFLLFFGDFLSNYLIYVPTVNIVYSIIFFVNFIGYYVLIELLCRAFYRKKEGWKNFLRSFAIIFIPSDIYLIIHFAFLASGILQIPALGIIDNILMIIFQVWSLWLVIYILTAIKNLKIENALIISLLLHYGGFSIILLVSL
jgi:hypothetical protein